MRRFLFICGLVLGLSAFGSATIPCGNTGPWANTGGGATYQYGSGSGGTGHPDCTPAANSTVASCTVTFVTSPSGNFQCGLFDSDGTGSIPKTVLCSTAKAAVGSGTQTYTLTGCPGLIAGHGYYPAVWFDTANQVKFTSGTGTYQVASLPSGLQTSSSFVSTGVASVAVYLNITASSGSSPNCAIALLGAGPC